MKILSIDAARHSGWAVFDYENKIPIAYGSFDYSAKYSFEEFMVKARDTILSIAGGYGIDAIFIEDIQLQANTKVFKQLAILQGCFVSAFLDKGYLYDLVTPSQWQNYCNARGRTGKELKEKKTAIEAEGKKASKVLSIEFVKNTFNIDTDNDNLADAICQGYYVVNNIHLKKGYD